MSAHEQYSDIPRGQVIGSYDTYVEAQRAVDYLSDQQFPVQHVSIVGSDLKVDGTRLWRLSDEGLGQAFAERRILIADGHHRYETALAYHEETGTPESGYMMVVLVSLEDPGLTRAWRESLRRVSAGERLPGTLAGRATRLRHDVGELGSSDVAGAMARALSPGEEPERGASWIEGFIGTSGLILVHDPELLQVLDDWIDAVGPDAFTNVLPLLRRAFSVLPAGERRRLGERLRRGAQAAPEAVAPLDLDRTRPALETVASLLG